MSQTVPAMPLPGRVLTDALPGAKVRDAVLVLAGAALLALSAQVAVPLPFTPVPITGQTFAVMLLGSAYGVRRGLASMALYLAVGFAGAPVFSLGRTGGEMLQAPSFGYVVGMALAVALVGRLAERAWDRRIGTAVGQMVLGNLVVYAVGVPWLAVAAGFGAQDALAKGLVPFLVGDAIKIALAAGLLPATWRLVRPRD